MLPQKEIHLVYYREFPGGGLISGSVELEGRLPGSEICKLVVEAFRTKYGETAELVASHGEEISTKL